MHFIFNIIAISVPFLRPSEGKADCAMQFTDLRLLQHTHTPFFPGREGEDEGEKKPFSKRPPFPAPTPFSRPFVHGPFDSQTEKPNFGSFTHSDNFRECRNEAELIERRPYFPPHLWAI